MGGEAARQSSGQVAADAEEEHLTYIVHVRNCVCVSLTGKELNSSFLGLPQGFALRKVHRGVRAPSIVVSESAGRSST